MKAAVLGFVAVALAATIAHAAADRASAKEAEAMVHKAAADIRANRDQAFARINDIRGPYVDRDLYIVVYRTDGTNLAHGFSPKFVGKNLMEISDIDGKQYMRERMDWAKSKGAFWQDLKFVDPITRKIEPKQVYCQKVDDMLVCGGVYKM
jgi:signal transduction histidine kinase